MLKCRQIYNNLLNNFSGNYREHYVDKILHLVKSTSEKYFETHKIINNDYFLDLGITDTLILECAKDCNLLVSSDSKLSDYTRAFGIKVYDMKVDNPLILTPAFRSKLTPQPNLHFSCLIDA